ncbi:hypothetical protein GMDG_05272 [Pseudogymnoascus destructans 20631-21]|uniref:Uncharacterized protein n=1 Tax=Pseudogymnoascus destructans (strain ATCC MYA-4855 / 20631-21) TaxID=658429 RepID=L8FMJ1_PSED2|nr:hypothetical protein GMDG_05272 [Pseudogymnoascus destructans 20631-21]
MFSYEAAHRIIICELCQSVILPGLTSQQWHLRNEPHRLLGDALAATIRLFEGYELCTVEQLRLNKPGRDDGCRLIERLQSFDGFCCLHAGCSHCTVSEKYMKEHVWQAHKIKAKDHKVQPLWKGCKLQTYSTAKGRIDYFVVTEESDAGSTGGRTRASCNADF